jgi:hypothetical protein
MVAYLSLEPVAPEHLLTPLRNVCLVAFNIGSVVTIHLDILRRGNTSFRKKWNADDTYLPRASSTVSGVTPAGPNEIWVSVYKIHDPRQE